MTTKQGLVDTIRQGLTYEGAPQLCEECSDPYGSCQTHNVCMCDPDDDGLDCHAKRLRFINKKRALAITALDELAELVVDP